MDKSTTLTALEAAQAAYLQAEQDRDRAAHAAKDAGASFAELAAKLGISKQRAHQRYSAPRDTSRDHLYTPAENAEADKVLAALQAVAARQDAELQQHHTAAVQFISGITVGPPHVAEWPEEVRRKPSKKVDAKVPAPATPLKKWTPESAQESYIDRRPKFHLESAGRIDGVAQPGTGKGPHNCPRCSSTNHKDGGDDLIRAYPGECKPTKYDPRDIAAWLTAQPAK